MHYHTLQFRYILRRNGKYYPMLSSPQIWIVIPVSLISLKLNIPNTKNGLKMLVAGLILQNMFYNPPRSVIMPPRISSSVLTFALLKNQRHPIFALNIFVGICTPSSNLYQSGISKVSHFSILIINYPNSKERINIM